MPHLSWNEVRDRAIRFSLDPVHLAATSERAEKQTFWNAFFEVFGLRRASFASFEENVRNLKGHTSASGFTGHELDGSSRKAPSSYFRAVTPFRRGLVR